MRLWNIAAVVGVVVFSCLTAANAATYEIRMLNMSSHGMFQFEPRQLKINPGDTVHFIAKDKGHNVQSIDGMLPAGAAPFKGEINKDLTVTFTQPGVYGFKCVPHYALGMVGLITVGDSMANLKKAESVVHPGKAQSVFVSLFKALTNRTAARH